MNKNTRNAFVATIVAVTGCSSEPIGDLAASSAQPLNAGEFVLLNEVELNPPGAGNAPWQYIELEGTPGALLSGIQLVVVDGATRRVEMVVDLGACGGACAVGTNGIFMIKAADSGTGAVGHTPAAGTGVFKDAQLSTTPLTFANTAVLLVQGPAAITEGAILAASADAGTAVLPAGDALVDGIGWGAGGALSGVTLTQQGGGAPDAATRFPGRRERNAAAWYDGNLVPPTSTVNYNPAQASANFPATGRLTPGAPNVPEENDGGLDAGDGAKEGAATDAADTSTDAPHDGADATSDVVADHRDESTLDATHDGADSNGDGPTPIDVVTDARPDVRDATGDANGSGGGPSDAGDGSAGAGGMGGSTGGAGAGGTAGSGGGGAGGAGGAGGTAGVGGTAGSGGTQPGTAGAAGTSSPPVAGDEGGCGCHVATPAPNARSVFALFGVVALFAARRKKSTRR
jgi:MYXO-CTERM domain-containing protein